MSILSYNIIIANGIVVKILNQLKKVNIQVFFIHNAIKSYSLSKYKINRNKDSVSNEGLCSANKKLNTRYVNFHIWQIQIPVTS